jgi:hypothetical protein
MEGRPGLVPAKVCCGTKIGLPSHGRIDRRPHPKTCDSMQLPPYHLQALTPAGIELSLNAAGDIERERPRLDTHGRAEVRCGGYEARLAERNYRAVDPEDRLGARTLEQRWERALRREQELREGYDCFRRESPRRLAPKELDRNRELDAHIPSLWHEAETPVRRSSRRGIDGDHRGRERLTTAVRAADNCPICKL